MNESKNLTTISTENQVVTLINVFTVEPSNQKKVVQLLQNDIEEVIRNLPGWVSCSIHVSHDGNTVVNYAQWKTKDDWEAMIRNPEAQKRIGNIHKLATLDSHLYKVESVHHI